MNAFAFFILGALVVAAALAAVVLPNLRHAGASLLGFTAAVGILSVASGAYATGALQLLLPAIVLVLMSVSLAGTRIPVITGAKLPSRRAMVVGAAVSIGFAALLLTTFAIGGSGWHAGAGVAALVSVLHLRTPYAFVIALITVVIGVGGALMAGRTGSDERRLDRTLEERRLRDERAQRRREDRDAARRSRGTVADEGGG